MKKYVHGYSKTENNRLYGQTGTLTSLLHSDTRYKPRKTVLEAGCGVGAQTVILAKNSSKAKNHFHKLQSVDIFIIVNDASKDNWGIRGGQMASEVNIGFKIDV